MISNDVISFEHIIHISQKTTEQINKKNLKDFLITSLERQSFPKLLYNRIIYRYFPHQNIYEIYAFKTHKKKNILEYQLFEYFYTEQNIIPNGYDIFICEDYFCIYKDGKFFFAKENKSYKENEIVDYVKHFYKISLGGVYTLSKNDMESLAQNTNKLHPVESIILYKNNLFIIIYTLLLLSFFTYIVYEFYNAYYQNSDTQNTQQHYKLKDTYKKLLETKPKQLSDEIQIIFFYLDKYNIGLKSFVFDKKYVISMTSNKRDDIYKFAHYFKNKITIEHITYNDEHKVYFVELYIER
jgi:hypothetical protein